MKPWMTKFWVRLVAVIVFIVMALAAILSALGIWACVESRVYADGGAQLRQDALDSLAHRMDDTVSEYYRAFRDNEDTQSAKEYWEPYFSKERSNFFFRIKDASGNVLLQSYSAPSQYHSRGDFEEAAEIFTTEQTFDSEAKRQAWLEDFAKNHQIWSDSQWEDYNESASPISYHIAVDYSKPSELTIERYIAKDFTAKDEISFVMGWVDRVINMRNALPWICGISALLALAALVFLIVIAGRRNEDGSVRLTWFDRIPLDLLLVIYISLLGINFAIADELFDRMLLFAAIFSVPIWIALGVAFLMTVAARCRAGTIWKNNLTYHVCGWLWKGCKWLWGALGTLVKSLPLFWKTLLIWAGISLIELLALASWGRDDMLLLFWFFEKLILTPLILFGVIGMQRLRSGTKSIRGGDLDSKINFKYLYGPFREHAEDLNAITDGLQNAVEDRVKSERMKAELITNVSHDIKTPLTSIVNYVDLLSKEDLQNERAEEYVDVLTRQAQRLKKLTDDLVEASKASTGNIEVHKEPVDLNVLLSQAAGEFSDRLAKKGLEPVLTTAPEQPKAMADGQLLWRVFSNLLTNIVKYAMPGTRVYLSNTVREGAVLIAFRNISNAPLNISGEELTERFVRGDRSRTDGEGSGLGLSIARSLIELQGGNFDVTTDGDLFKATIEFQTI